MIKKGIKKVDFSENLRHKEQIIIVFLGFLIAFYKKYPGQSNAELSKLESLTCTEENKQKFFKKSVLPQPPKPETGVELQINIQSTIAKHQHKNNACISPTPKVQIKLITLSTLSPKMQPMEIKRGTLFLCPVAF